MADRTVVVLTAGEEFHRVANALREVDASLPAQFRKELKRAVKPLVAEAKRRVRSMPVSGRSGHTGLRRRVARGVRVLASTGATARLRVITVMEDQDEAIIPRGLDRHEGWRHPVFGRGSVWQTHAPGSWFTDTFQDGHDEIERGLHDVLEDAANKIARAGGDVFGT